jgi:tetratricopeptide (TPR) repeat protein
MALQPEDRYDSARALAQDIEHWLADEPVSAWHEPWLVRARRWAKRHRTAVAATAAACAAALLLGGIGLYSYQRQVRQETAVAEAALVRAEQTRSDARAAWSERLDSTAWARAEDLASAAAVLDSRRLPARVRRRVRELSQRVKAEAGVARADARLLDDLAAVRAARNDPQYDATSEYGRAFRRRGLSIDVGDPVAVVSRMGGRPVPATIQIASHLDDWALLLRSWGGSRDRADQLTVLARDIDPDPWRDALRGALSLPDPAERRRAVLRMAAAPDAAAQPSPTITLLAVALRGAGETGVEIGLLEAARFRYPEHPWVYFELGLALRAARPTRREDALRAFTAATTLRPEMGHELAITLRDTGRTAEAISVLEDVIRRHTHAWYLIELGKMKAASGRRAEAVELFRQAAALSRDFLERAPDDFGANNNLATALRYLRDHAGATVAFRKMIRLNPHSALAHNNLGNALHDLGDRDGAIAKYKEAIRLDPDFALAHANLGIVLRDSGDQAGAITELRESLRLGYEPAQVHFHIGAALRNSGDWAGALAELQDAIRLKPDFAEAHNHLGLVLRESGDLAGAIAKHREALRLNRDLADAHNYHGVALQKSGDLAGAIAELQQATRSDPRSAAAHNNLAGALFDSGDLAGAVAEFKEATRLDPNDPLAHCNLGHALRALGRFQEALDAMERGHKFGSRRPGWQRPSADWVKECRRLVGLEGRLFQILSGQYQPADALERVELASVAQIKGLYVAAACLFAEAFTERPALASDVTSSRRYNAARAAALASCGRGRDEPPPGPTERARLRAQALGWLKADLAAWADHLKGSPNSGLAMIVPQLQHWRNDPDLTGVRDTKELAKLPELERHEWQALWAAVDALVRRAEEPAIQSPDPPAGELPADPFAR